MKNIILCGRMGSGKSTVAQILKDKHGYKEVEIGSMIKLLTHSLYRATLRGAADSYIVQLSVALLGKPNDAFMHQVRVVSDYLANLGFIKDKGLLRYAYQQFGTECVRKHSPNTWMKLAQQQAVAYNRRGFPVVVSDVRLHDEYCMFVDAGYLPFEVFAPVQVRTERLIKRDNSFDPETLKHVSETVRFSCPVIDNTGSMADLRRAIRRIIEQEKAKVS